MAQLRKPGRLSKTGIQINLKAMKPGAKNPYLESMKLMKIKKSFIKM